MQRDFIQIGLDHAAIHEATKVIAAGTEDGAMSGELDTAVGNDCNIGIQMGFVKQSQHPVLHGRKCCFGCVCAQQQLQGLLKKRG